MSRFLVSRNDSMMHMALSITAEYVTPHSIEGRVAPINSGSAMSPALRCCMCHSALGAEHPADPGDNLRRSKGNRNTDDKTDKPTPRGAAGHGKAACDHHQNDGNGRQPRENVGLQRGGAREKRRGLCLHQFWECEAYGKNERKSLNASSLRRFDR